MSRKILGLDIGCDRVAAVLIESSMGENRIAGTGLVSIPEAGTWAEGLGTALTELNGRMSLSGAVCAASFPANHISFRNVRIPFRNAKKIGQVLPFELEPLLPFPADEVITDFLTVRQVPDQPDQTDIVALSIPKSEMKICLDTLLGFRVDPGTVMPGPYPTAVCLNMSEKMPENWILLDMGERVGTMFIVLSGKIHLMRCFPVQGSGDERGKLAGALIGQTLLAFEDMFFQTFEPEQVFVCGDTGDGNIAGELERLTGIPVKYANLLERGGNRIRLSPDAEWRPGQMDNALALALTELGGKNGLNFRRGMFAARKEWAVHKKNLIRVAVFCAVLALLGFANFMTEALVMQKRIDRLDSRIAEIFKSVFPDVQRIVNPLHQMQVGLEDLRKNAAVPGEGGRNIRITDLLNEISQKIPKEIDVEFSRMVMDPESILISGDTDTFNSVDSIQTSLEGSTLFRKVTISSTSKDQKINRVNFKIKVDL